MKRVLRQLFLLLPLLLVRGELRPADSPVYRAKLLDVDGQNLSTGDGHITLIVLASLANIDRARLVGDRTPEHCIGNPAYRMITVIEFGRNRSRPVRAIFKSLVRRRLNQEAKRLLPRYRAKGLPQDPRKDVFAVADFDRSAISQFASPTDSPDFRLIVLAADGSLLRQWDDVPSADELAAVLK